jgi:hypothetical protein
VCFWLDADSFITGRGDCVRRYNSGEHVSLHVRRISVPVGSHQTYISTCWSTSDISVPVGPRQTYRISVSVGPHQPYIHECWSTSDHYRCLLFHVRYIRVCSPTSDIYQCLLVHIRHISVTVGPRYIYPCLLAHVRHISMRVAGFESTYSAFDHRSSCCRDQVNI